MGLLDNTTQGAYYNSNDFGNYQFVSLEDIINQFMVIYVGEEKIISKIRKLDVAFHAQRALAELSFDTFKSVKAQEIEIPDSLTMILPQDYVNYTKISWVDSSGIKHLLHPARKTSNPFKPQVDSNNEPLFDSSGSTISSGELITNGDFIGGSDGWILNQIEYTTGWLQTQTITISPNTATLGDPSQGWFYGFNGNAVAAYNVPQHWGIRQENIPIIAGEKYKITYTLSGYVGGEWRWHIIDGQGDVSNTTGVTANGTYEETITAGGTNANHTANSIMFRNEGSSDGNVVIDSISMVRVGDEETSSTWSNYKSITPSENTANDYNYDDDRFDLNLGQRYGIDPTRAQVNGSFYIDELKGRIHFSSNISGKTVVLDYISDSLGTDEEMRVHKFAEDAMYKSILCGVLYARRGIPPNALRYYKRDKFAAVRQAKLRLSNIKIEELTQILRGKSKQIKH